MDRESAISRNILMALVAAVAIIFVVIVGGVYSSSRRNRT